MKRPDAFEEMVERQVRRDVRIHSIDDTSAIMLLRAYHQRVVRVVKAQYPAYDSTIEERAVSKALTDVLTALARLKAGRR